MHFASQKLFIIACALLPNAFALPVVGPTDRLLSVRFDTEDVSLFGRATGDHLKPKLTINPNAPPQHHVSMPGTANPPSSHLKLTVDPNAPPDHRVSVPGTAIPLSSHRSPGSANTAPPNPSNSVPKDSTTTGQRGHGPSPKRSPSPKRNPPPPGSPPKQNFLDLSPVSPKSFLPIASPINMKTPSFLPIASPIDMKTPSFLPISPAESNNSKGRSSKK